MKLFKKSNYLNRINYSNGIIIFHSLFGNARFIDSASNEILECFNTSISIDDVFEQLNVNDNEKPIVKGIVNDFVSARFICLEGIDEREILRNHNEEKLKLGNNDFPFEFIGFSVTKKCNFACKYCIAGSNSVETDLSFDFNGEKLYFYIKLFAKELLHYNKKKLNIGFTGGEPLTRWETLKSIIEKIYFDFSDKLEIKISINTNLSLMTEEIAQFFQDYNIYPSTSLDGIEEVNNNVRVYKTGKGTFQDIMRGISLIRKHNIVCDSFYLTLTKMNFDFDIISLMDFAHANHFSSITIEPDLVNVMDIEPELVCQKLVDCYCAAKERGIKVTGFWERPFLNMINFEDSTSGFCRALDFKSIVVDKDGYLSPCGYSRTQLAHINNFFDLAHDENYISFIRSNLRGNIEVCKGCEIEGLCKGGCLITRENYSGGDAFAYRCVIYKKMTRFLLMNAMFS